VLEAEVNCTACIEGRHTDCAPKQCFCRPHASPGPSERLARAIAALGEAAQVVAKMWRSPKADRERFTVAMKAQCEAAAAVRRARAALKRARAQQRLVLAGRCSGCGDPIAGPAPVTCPKCKRGLE
jgi:hypothetical protein